MSDDTVVKDGKVYGGWRQPPNIWINSWIHNDGTAQKIGMRGGTIPGTIHLNLFAPLIIEFFGQRWFEKGSLSMFYTYATLDREEVRAVIEVPPKDAGDVQVGAWVETPEGQTVAKGTLAVGEPQEASYVRNVSLDNTPSEDLRILAGLRVGEEVPPRENVVFTQEELDKVLETITDPLDWYKGNSPWGASILNPSSMYTALNVSFPPDRIAPAVGFFGATELRNINGPLKANVPYRNTGKVICIGASPKTEFAWVDSELHEQESGKLIADMRHMTRWMKNSSPLYQES
ncbi:MAG TPA: hypothetical protein G4O07_01730 [Dehalococcoidia bacterium]|nr:hypothetical protein [Dehalococcoidia bacterium]